MTSRAAGALLALLVLPVPAEAAAPRPEKVLITSHVPTRIDHAIGFVPITGPHPRGQRTVPFRVRQGGRTFRFVFLPTTLGGGTAATTLRLMREARANGLVGAFVDHRLGAAEAKAMAVRADLGRDADVLAVAADHPACAGLPRAAARAIATGQATAWSQVGLTVEPDAITLVHTGTRPEVIEPRLGAPFRPPPASARVQPDGGLGAAASGDPTVAAVTSWSRARRQQARTCAVPLDGVAPTDTAVASLQYPEAYPITYAAPRWTTATTSTRAAMRAYVGWLDGPKGRALLRGRGMLLTGEAWPPAG